ncbi:MAG: glycosyltransferase family A protein [Patescibacteria group bacterium]
MVKISIITSTYNEYAKNQLQQAVSSILRQTYQNWELIIVGDCAPDADQINQFLTKIGDNRIKFINLTKRAGIGSPGTIPKIEGVKLAKGELLCFLDADNLYFPKHLELCAKAFEADPKLDLAYGDTLVKIFNFKFLIFNQFLISNFQWKKPEWTRKRQKLLMTSNFLDMSEPVFTRKAYFDAGGLNPSHHASDWLLWKAMINSGHRNFKHLDNLGVIYHTSSLTHHLQYFGLMLLQKSGLPYHSDRLKWMQANIKRRFERKHS